MGDHPLTLDEIGDATETDIAITPREFGGPFNQVVFIGTLDRRLKSSISVRNALDFLYLLQNSSTPEDL